MDQNIIQVLFTQNEIEYLKQKPSKSQMEQYLIQKGYRYTRKFVDGLFNMFEIYYLDGREQF